ncbi:phenylalanine--tRNA ligase subunit beta [Lactovum miscens]|uniref:Phenylalanine--tRNA ligase beta subunit n=1 Tax=Lactovum miscens TaxID=190387 RepID=A0A841C847_9LACT|nr:phenylalanine--tRNA ligase subunit beta [Lactovum miscens]MBB5887410.1 phenylalanyl-tRNA synthetase beta chain [Lactovum miscens]
MNISYKWLKKLVPDLTARAEDLEEKMSTTGIEVEGVTTPAFGLSKLVVGEIVSFEDISETHLHVCKVNVGEVEPLQIVCGAGNIRVGMKTITALVGARIAENTKIKKGKMRGYESFGMLCALDELGVSDRINPMKHEEGIYEMPIDAIVGDSIFPYLDMDDEIIELSITPNRADALSMLGVAHEVAAIYGLEVKKEIYNLVESDQATVDQISIKVETDNVPTYKIRIIKDVKIAKSPVWLQNRLMNAGIKPINNVVDVTNYVLMYYGQPLHSFDFGKFGSDEILVRQAKNGEKLTTLDHIDRELTSEDIVITSAGLPVGLAGVMGGENTEITDKTVTVALEAALFDPISIRKTSQKYNLRSEASSRFERGINQATVREALDFAAAMITKLAGGEVLKGVVESNNFQPELVKVSISLGRINASLGTELSQAQVKTIFEALGFSLAIEGDKFVCEIPSRRWDIHIEADLIEEVARMYGYDKLPATLPSTQNAGERTPMQKLRLKLRKQLEAAGLNEVIGYSLTTPEKSFEFSGDIDTTYLMMPMSEERQVLRTSMIPGLLDIINYNQNRKNEDVSIYEIGNVFLPSDAEDGRPAEVPDLAIAISGNITEKSWNEKTTPIDFFYAKGIVENILAGYDRVEFEPYSENKGMHPGRTARIKLNDRVLGFVGQVHPALVKKYDIAETYVAVLDVNILIEEVPHQTVFEEIPKVQAVTRDIALIVKEEISHAEIFSAIKSRNVKNLKKIELFDVFSGGKLGAGLKSMAYTLTFQNLDDTMTDEQINNAMNKIMKSLSEKVQAEIR